MEFILADTYLIGESIKADVILKMVKKSSLTLKIRVFVCTELENRFKVKRLNDLKAW